jgi:hypothetical protein
MATKPPTRQLRHNPKRTEIIEHAAAVALGDVDAPVWQVAIAKHLIRQQTVIHRTPAR